MTTSDHDAKSAFWKTLIRAAGAEPCDLNTTIAGASGLRHPVIAMGADEDQRRIVIISGEPEARSAALAQADIQSAMNDVNVVMARPAPINLGAAAKIISDLIGTTRLGQREFDWFADNRDTSAAMMQDFITRILPDAVGSFTVGAFSIAALDIAAAFKEAIHQLTLVSHDVSEVQDDVDLIPPNPLLTLTATTTRTVHSYDFENLIQYDPIAADRSLGVCSIPLYDFTVEEAEVFHRGTQVDDAREILKQHNIFQYFFPAPDQLVLGLLDNDRLTSADAIERVSLSPRIGHPLGDNEIVDHGTQVVDLIDAIQSKGLATSGEVVVDITPEGASVRSAVRFKPREGFLRKLSRVFSAKVDMSLKDILQRPPQ